MSDDLDLGLRHDEQHDSRRGRRAARPHYGRRRVVIGIVMLAVVGILAGIGLAGASVIHRIQDHFQSAADYSGQGTGDVVIQVHDGDTLSAVGQTLKDKGVVASVEAFTDAASSNSRATSIAPGFYRLHQRMQATLALELLLDPSSLVQSQVTIPEGNRLREILPKLAAATDIPLAQLQKATRNPAALGVPSWGAGHPLEGFLFPATYDFPPGASAKQVLSAMVKRFNQEATRLDLASAAQQTGKSPYEVLTLASIIEKEGLPADFSKIAEVLYNRLRINMPLQVDSTSYYDLPPGHGGLTQSDLHRDSPYNTRINAGIPPTPIASPGGDALAAALTPAKGNLLYFVTIDKAGHAAFATNQTDFDRLVAQARRNGAL
jgi:UPF0755 protein